nr:basic proline-rich protein-like [Pan paniscus]
MVAAGSTCRGQGVTRGRWRRPRPASRGAELREQPRPPGSAPPPPRGAPRPASRKLKRVPGARPRRVSPRSAGRRRPRGHRPGGAVTADPARRPAPAPAPSASAPGPRPQPARLPAAARLRLRLARRRRRRRPRRGVEAAGRTGNFGLSGGGRGGAGATGAGPAGPGAGPGAGRAGGTGEDPPPARDARARATPPCRRPAPRPPPRSGKLDPARAPALGSPLFVLPYNAGRGVHQGALAGGSGGVGGGAPTSFPAPNCGGGRAADAAPLPRPLRLPLPLRAAARAAAAPTPTTTRAQVGGGAGTGRAWKARGCVSLPRRVCVPGVPARVCDGARGRAGVCFTAGSPWVGFWALLHSHLSPTRTGSFRELVPVSGPLPRGDLGDPGDGSLVLLHPPTPLPHRDSPRGPRGEVQAPSPCQQLLLQPGQQKGLPLDPQSKWFGREGVDPSDIGDGQALVPGRAGRTSRCQQVGAGAQAPDSPQGTPPGWKGGFASGTTALCTRELELPGVHLSTPANKGPLVVGETPSPSRQRSPAPGPTLRPQTRRGCGATVASHLRVSSREAGPPLGGPHRAG